MTTRISTLFCILCLAAQSQAQFAAGHANFTNSIARSIEADENQFNPQPPNADIQELRVDLNGDGDADLSFKTLILQNSPQNWQHTISCDVLQNPQSEVIVCANTWPVSYASFYQNGETIDPQCNGARNFLLSRYSANGALPFTPLDVDTTYIGFKFIENGDTTRGWLEIGLHNAAVTRFELHRIGSKAPLNSQTLITQTEQAAVPTADFRLSPNPAQHRVRIQLENGLQQADYRISDLTGRTVRQGYLNSNETSLDISQLQSGWYVVQLISDEQMITRRLRVQ